MSKAPLDELFEKSQQADNIGLLDMLRSRIQRKIEEEAQAEPRLLIQVTKAEGTFRTVTELDISETLADIRIIKDMVADIALMLHKQQQGGK